MGRGSQVTVYVSMPTRGYEGAIGRDVVRGARLALAQAHNTAGDLAVRAVYLDDTEPGAAGARWSPSQAAANARTAIEDSTAIAYIGELDSGATRSSLPITNEARLLQVSPASGAVDLVTPFRGSDAAPKELQRTGERTFGRVIPADDVTARAARRWAPGAVVLYPDASTDRLERVPGSRAVSAAQDPAQLPATGRRFADAYVREYGDEPGRYAAYGYEATAVVLDSIARAGEDGTNRAAVIDEFFATDSRESVLGTYSIDDLGETTLDRLAGYRVDSSGLAFVRGLTAPRPAG